MSDEFPTLEVALAAGVVLLFWRGWLLRRTRLGLVSASERLFEAVRRGAPDAHALTAKDLGPLLEPLALAAPARDLPRAVRERTTRLRHRMRSAAARDLVICGVLAGSLLYVLSSDIVRGWPFFALGGAATLLLLVAVAERLRLDRELARIGSRFGNTQGSTTDRAHPGTRAGRGSTPEPVACNACGAPDLEHWTEESELGAKLWSLGARELFVCRRCGHVMGEIRRTTPPTDPWAESAPTAAHGKGP